MHRKKSSRYLGQMLTRSIGLLKRIRTYANQRPTSTNMNDADDQGSPRSGSLEAIVQGTTLTDEEIIRGSDLFDEDWYTKSYLLNRKREQESASHYLKEGWRRGYNPSPQFNTVAYLRSNHDVAIAEINPLLHYEKHGRSENRSTGQSPSKIKTHISRVITRYHSPALWSTYEEEGLLQRYASIELPKNAIQASIVMPTYNRGHCITDAITSVLKQTHTNWQLIVVDDGSTDNTLDILSSFADERIITVSHDHCRGASAARNTGLAKTTGEFIFFLDSDNRWRNHYIETMLKHVHYFKVDAAYCAACICDDEWRPESILYEDFDLESCLARNFIDLNTFCISSSLKELCFDQSLKRLIDWDYIVQIAARTVIIGAQFIGVDYYNGARNARITNSVYQNEHEFDSAKQHIIQKGYEALLKQANSHISNKETESIAVIFHIEDYDGLLICNELAEAENDSCHLYITTNTSRGSFLAQKIRTSFPNAIILHYHNRCRAAAAFLQLASTLSHYDIVCHIDSSTAHLSVPLSRFRDILKSVFGSREVSRKIRSGFSETEARIIGPELLFTSGLLHSCGDIGERVLEIADSTVLESQLYQNWGFFSNSAYWIRPRFLLDLARAYCNSLNQRQPFRTALSPDMEEEVAKRLVGLSVQGNICKYIYLTKLDARGNPCVGPYTNGLSTYFVDGSSEEDIVSTVNQPFNSHPKRAGDEESLQSNTICRELFFDPDYRANNSYQTLLYMDGFESYRVVPGTIEDCIESAINYRLASRSSHIVFHLHWVSPVLSAAGDIYEAQSRAEQFLARLQMAKLLGVRIMWTVHNAISHEPKYSDAEIDLRANIARLSDWIHIHHECALEEIRSLYHMPDEKIIVAHHGNYVGSLPISMTQDMARRQLGIEQFSTVFLFLGQIRGYKGIDELISTFKQLQCTSDACLVIAGKLLGVTHEELEDQISECENIRLHPGYIAEAEMQHFLVSADAVVLPYKKVLTSGSVMMAISHGLPVICPRIGLLPTIIKNGVNGILYDQSVKESLRHALRDYLAMRMPERREMSIHALETAKKYSWQESSMKLINHLEASRFGQVLHTHIQTIQRRWFVFGDISTATHRECLAIILHYQNISDTVNLARSIGLQGSDVYPVIISNSESFKDVQRIKNLVPEALVIQSSDNVGYAAANNLGLWLSSEFASRFFWIINPDMIISKGCYSKLKRAATVFNSVNFFGTTIVHSEYPDTVLFCGGGVDLSNGAKPSHLYMGTSLSNVPLEPFHCDYLTGANIFGRVSGLESAGYLPEDYFLYFEETDWFMRQQQLNVAKPMILPQIVVLNHKRSEERGIPSKYYVYYFIRNFLIFGKKYAPDSYDQCKEEVISFRDAWLTKIANRSPHELPIYQKIASQAISDGLKGVLGKSHLVPSL